MNTHTTRVNSKIGGQKRLQYRGKELLILSNLNQHKKSLSRSNQESTSSGRYDYGTKKCTKGISKKQVTVQQTDKIHISPKLFDKKQVSRRSALTEKKALSKDVHATLSLKNAHPGDQRRPCEQSIPRSYSRKVEGVPFRKYVGNYNSKQQSKLQPPESEAKQVKLQNHAAQIRHYPEQAVDSKYSHEQFSFSSSIRQDHYTQVSPQNDSGHVEKPFQLQPAVTKPDTFHTKPTDTQGTYSPKKETANDQRRPSTASEKSSEQASSFFSVRLADNMCASPENTSKNDCSKQLQLKWLSLSSVRQVDNTQVFLKNDSRNVDREQFQLQPAVTKPDTFHTKPRDLQGTYSPNTETVNDQRRPSTASEKSSEQASSYCSVRNADNMCVSPENNSKDDCSNQVQNYPTIHFLTTHGLHSVDNNNFNNKRMLYNTSEQPNEISSPMHQNVCVDDVRKLPIVKEQSFESCSSFYSVRQAETPISTDNTSGINKDNDQLQSHPRFTGTNTFLTQPKAIEDEYLQGDVTYKRLCNDHELSFGRYSSSCSVQQANARVSAKIKSRNVENEQLQLQSPVTVTETCLAKPKDTKGTYPLHTITVNAQRKISILPEQSIERYSLTWRPLGRNLCQEITEDHSIQHLSGERLKERDCATIVQLDRVPEMKELQNNLPYLKLIGDVSIKTEDDSQPCQITGFCQLENGTIVLTELNNKAIKTLNCHNYRVTDTMSLLYYPMDICAVEKSEALVILHESSSQCRCICIKVHDSIEQKQEVVLKHDCICVAYCNAKIFIGNSKCKGVYIYDKYWNELDMISNDLVGNEEIFSNQFSISVFVHDNETIIYIADEDNGMHSLTDTGKEIKKRWKFKDHETFRATGMCSDSKDDILLIDGDSQRLIKMNTEGMILAILLDNRNIYESINIPFQNKGNNNLIISLSGKDIIRVFDFK